MYEVHTNEGYQSPQKTKKNRNLVSKETDLGRALQN